MAPHVVRREEDSDKEETVGDDDEGGENGPRDHARVALRPLVVLPARPSRVVPDNAYILLTGHLSHVPQPVCYWKHGNHDSWGT